MANVCKEIKYDLIYSDHFLLGLDP